MFYVYFLYAPKSDEWYVGYTSKEPEQRCREHNRPSNRCWTRGRKWDLVYYEAYPDEYMAKGREYDLKHDGRSRKRIIKRLDRLHERAMEIAS